MCERTRQRLKPRHNAIGMQGIGLVFLFAGFIALDAQGPYQTTGIRVGEVTDRSAIVWTRLTRNPVPNPSSAPMVKIDYVEATPETARRRRDFAAARYPSEGSVQEIRHAAPGNSGQVRVRYKTEAAQAWTRTQWQSVDSNRDFTHQFQLERLRPNSRYLIEVQSRTKRGSRGETVVGSFKTAPAAAQENRVVFAVSTGQRFPHRDGPHGFDIYPQILKLEPSFFVHTGDIVYYDELAKNVDLARYHWQRTYSLPTNVEFHRQVGSYFIKDDHDVWVNDCWPTMATGYMGDFTFKQGVELFKEQVPMGDKTYRTIRWGKDLQIWLVEGRDFRSPNTMPDVPDKTIWGVEQMVWFKRTVKKSDATFRVLISPTPIVGPDRQNKRDNHSNKVFTHEGNEIREFIAGQKNMLVVCGDRHWQYHSIDPNTGIHEYSCGPASDAHAGGWNQEDFVNEYHRYLNVIGGFLTGTVERVGGQPNLTFRYYDSQGQVTYEHRFEDETSDTQETKP